MGPVFRNCGLCGRQFATHEDWVAGTELIGVMDSGTDGVRYVDELRNCDCGTTHSEPLSVERARYLEASGELTRAAESLAAKRKAIRDIKTLSALGSL